MSFFFSRMCRHTSTGSNYPAMVFPTNLANWGSNDLVGNVTAVNIGEGEITVYFTRTNPLEAVQLSSSPDNGLLELSIADRQALTAKAEEMKVLAIPGSEALLGMSLDLIPYTDLNWVTIISEGTTQELDVYVQLVEQRMVSP